MNLSVIYDIIILGIFIPINIKEFIMKALIKSFDELPLILQIIFALPVLDIIWAIYRIVKGAAYGNVLTLIAGIVWIVAGATICWVLDLVFLILGKQPLLA